MAAPDGVQMVLNNMKIRLTSVYTHSDLATTIYTYVISVSIQEKEV